MCRPEALAVAVSGGVDSMTLAAVAHRARGGDVTMIHAISPAVPEAATARVRRHAERHGWATIWLDAGEMVITDGLNKVRPGVVVDAATAEGG